MNAVRILAAVVVIGVWAALYVTSIVRDDFSAPPEVSGVMLMVVTYLFGRALRDGLSNTLRDKGQKLIDSLPKEEDDDGPQT